MKHKTVKFRILFNKRKKYCKSKIIRFLHNIQLISYNQNELNFQIWEFDIAALKKWKKIMLLKWIQLNQFTKFIVFVFVYTTRLLSKTRHRNEGGKLFEVMAWPLFLFKTIRHLKKQNCKKSFVENRIFETFSPFFLFI